MTAEFNARLMLSGKVAEFVGGPFDGDRFELPGWALMHDGAVAVPDPSVGLEAVFQPTLDLSQLKVALYQPDWAPPMLTNGLGSSIRLTPDGQALRYIFIPPDDNRRFPARER
jgi:hypothetical protein